MYNECRGLLKYNIAVTMFFRRLQDLRKQRGNRELETVITPRNICSHRSGSPAVISLDQVTRRL